MSPCRTTDFSLVAQRKRRQKKRHPGFRAAAAQRFPAMLDTPAAAETRGCAAQTVSDGQPRRACASRRFAKGPNIKSNVKSKSSAQFERRTYYLSRSRERVREREEEQTAERQSQKRTA